MSRLPQQVDPWRAADQGRCLNGSVRLADMPRLAELLLQSAGEVRFELEFFRDGKKRPCIKGTVKTTVAVECQRCLGPVEIDVDTQLLLCLVQSPAEAETLPDDYDPFLVDVELGVDPMVVLEDEILLTLPQVPLHRIEDCEANLPEENSEEPEAENPFQVLAQLKNRIH